MTGRPRTHARSCDVGAWLKPFDLQRKLRHDRCETDDNTPLRVRVQFVTSQPRTLATSRLIYMWSLCCLPSMFTPTSARRPPNERYLWRNEQQKTRRKATSVHHHNHHQFIIIMKEFIVRLLQCDHEHRCITLSIKLKSVVTWPINTVSLQSYNTV